MKLKRSPQPRTSFTSDIHELLILRHQYISKCPANDSPDGEERVAQRDSPRAMTWLFRETFSKTADTTLVLTSRTPAQRARKFLRPTIFRRSVSWPTARTIICPFRTTSPSLALTESISLATQLRNSPPWPNQSWNSGAGPQMFCSTSFGAKNRSHESFCLQRSYPVQALPPRKRCSNDQNRCVRKPERRLRHRCCGTAAARGNNPRYQLPNRFRREGG